MKASGSREDSQLQQGPQDTFLDKEQRLKQKLKQKQEERQLRRSGSNVPSSSTEQEHIGDGDGVSNPADALTDTATASTDKNSNGNTGDPPSADGVNKNRTHDGDDDNPVLSDRSNGKQKQANPTGNTDGERRRNVEQPHHRARHGSRGRGNSPPSQKREWPYPNHPRGAGGPPWNIMRDDYGRAIPSQFPEDPHHPSHFYDPYYDGPPPPYYHPPPRGGDYYMRDPYYGASPRGGPIDQPYPPHHYPPPQRGAPGGRYRDRGFDARRRPPEYDSRRSWDLPQPVGAAAPSADDTAVGALSKSSRVVRSRSRSIASSSRGSHFSESSCSSESDDSHSSSRRRSHRLSSPSSRSYSSSRSSRSSRASFSSDHTDQSRSKSKIRTKRSKHRREDRSKRKKKRSRTRKRRRDPSPNDNDEKPSTSSARSKGSDDESKVEDEKSNGMAKIAVTSAAVEEERQNNVQEITSKKRSRSASLDEENSTTSAMKTEQKEDDGHKEEAEDDRHSIQKSSMKRRQHDADSIAKKKRRKHKRSSRSSRSRSQSSSSVYSGTSSRSSRSSPSRSKTKEIDTKDILQEETEDQSAATKDQRTIFISQLVMRATEHDVRKFLRKYVGVSKVKQVIFLQDKRTGRHKGCSYVELGKLSDVKKAIEYDGQIPSFQRFPILIKPSEADKNYSSATGVELATAADNVLTAPTMLPSFSTTAMPTLATFTDSGGKKVVIQNVYIGSIDRLVTQAQLQAIFSQFGQLKNLHLPLDPATGLHRGYAFLSYSDAKSANLAIKTMAGQSIAGRQLKTGWASQASAPGVEVITSDELPEDYAERVQKVNAILMQVNGTGLLTIPLAAAALMPDPFALLAGSTLPVAAPVVSGLPINVQSVAEAALNAALGAPTASAAPSFSLTHSETAATPVQPQPPAAQETATPTSHILIHNMFNKDMETEDGWWEDIREEVTEECTTFGKVEKVVVMHEHPGGKVYVRFQNAEMAKKAANALEGRWFDQRQLHVEFVQEEDVH